MQQGLRMVQGLDLDKGRSTVNHVMDKGISTRAPRKASPGDFFALAPKKRPRRAPRSQLFAGLGRKQRRRTQPEPGALGGARRRRGELFWREKDAGQPRQRLGASSSPNGLGFPRGINGKAAAGQPCH